VTWVPSPRRRNRRIAPVSLRSCKIRRLDSVPGAQRWIPPKSPTIAHTWSGGASIVIVWKMLSSCASANAHTGLAAKNSPTTQFASLFMPPPAVYAALFNAIKP
jgi:hypothetical protein